MKMLPVAIAGLIVSLLFQCHSEAQFRYGRYGRSGGISINIPLGGYGYGGFGYGGYGGHGYGGYGPHVGIPIYPVPTYRSVPVYRVPTYRVPAYRVPIYRSYTPRVDSYSYLAQPSRRYTIPRRSYVYPQPSVDRASESEADIGQIFGNYQSARPVATAEDRSYFEDDFGEGAIDEKSLLQSVGVLKESLSRRSDDADIWLDYLNPDLIIETVQSGGDALALQELLKNYDGLSGNADLSGLWVEPGFRRTHQGLRTYVGNSADSVQTQSDNQSDINPVAAPVADPLTDSNPELPPDASDELPSPI